jgi:hypothetical protein
MQSSHPRTEKYLLKNSNFQTSQNSIERQYGFSYHVVTTGQTGLSVVATIQASNDGVNWANTASAVTITANGSSILNVDAAHYMFTRLSFVFGAGRANFDTIFCSKGA